MDFSGVGSGLLDGADELLAEQCPSATKFNYRFTSFADSDAHIYLQLSAALRK